MTQNHAKRDHAAWSASSTDRNWNCVGARVLNALFPEEESEAAAWGTACHEISEACLREGREAIEFVGRFIKTKAHEIEVDEEMADTAQTYIDYVWLRCAEYKDATGDEPTLDVEQKFALDGISPPIESGGTADALLYFPKWKILEVVDLKGGRGVRVDAKGNKQARTYALGALLARPGLAVETVRSTIVQPRTDRKPKFEEINVVDLMEWTTDLLEKMHVSKAAEDEYVTITGDVSRAEWGKKYLCAGSHCKFCKAKPTCPALEQKALDAAAVWFDDRDKAHAGNTPDKMDPDGLAKALDVVDVVEEWVKAVRVFAHAQAESGVEIPGYVLVEKQGREKWKNEEGLRNSLTVLDVPDEVYLSPAKVRTPKQVRAALKKLGMTDVLDAIEDASEVPSAGTNLVAADKTTRPAVQAKPNQFFSAID